MSEEIVRPKKGKNDPAIGPVAVIVAMEQDLRAMRRSLGIKGRPACSITTSKLHVVKEGHREFSVVGPVLGAPHAVLVLEKLIVLGATKILFFGWCGSLQPGVRTGDFIVPDRGLIGEGTSAYYLLDNEYPDPSEDIFLAIVDVLSEFSIPCHQGPVWSTDAPYRETKDLVSSFQKQGIIAVDMELSALFTVSRFRQVELGALLLVSDELSSLRWKHGFATPQFKRSCQQAAQVIPAICKKLNMMS